jgi:branched-chain amino acid transport system substrate-binding protein
MDAHGLPVGYVLKGLQQLGWNIPILGDASVAATSLTSTAAPAGLVGTGLVKNLKMEVYESTVYTPSDKAVNTAVKAMTAWARLTPT